VLLVAPRKRTISDRPVRPIVHGAVPTRDMYQSGTGMAMRTGRQKIFADTVTGMRKEFGDRWFEAFGFDHAPSLQRSDLIRKATSRPKNGRQRRSEAPRSLLR
jgi:hypothetical protein